MADPPLPHAAPARSQRRSRPPSPLGRAGSVSSMRSWDAAEGRRSVTVLVRADRPAPSEDDHGDGSVLLDRAELEEMIRWETNELVKSLQEAEAEASDDGGEQARQLQELRLLVAARDREVARLQQLLDGQAGALDGAHAQVVEQARVIQQQEERIRQLLRQLEGMRVASRASVGSLDAIPAAFPEPVSSKQRDSFLPPIAAADDACFVQLPAQSYAEYQDCGFWRPLTESLQRHPRRWGFGALAAALLLLIILCATIIPLSRRTKAPQFEAQLAVVSTGSSWMDLRVRLDRPGLVSYLVMPQASLNVLVPGTSSTLLQLLQSDEVPGSAVWAASAPAAALASNDSLVLPGLASMAVACGWGAVPQSYQDTLISVLSAASADSAAACSSSSGSSGVGGGGGSVPACARCPRLLDSTGYTILAVGTTPDGSAISRVAVANGATAGGSAAVSSLDPPYVDNVNDTSFDLHFKLNAPGTLHYAVVLDSLLAPAGLSGAVAYSTAPLSSAAVAHAAPGAFLGGLVANGSMAVTGGGAWQRLTVRPPCVDAALCSQSLWALHSGTAYRVYAASEDPQRGLDAAPAVASFVTPAGPAQPALLPPTGPTDIGATSFSMRLAADAAGGVYWALAAVRGNASLSEPSIGPGGWQQVDALPRSSSPRRRLLDNSSQGSGGSSSGSLLAPGQLVPDTCPPANATCAGQPAAAFASVPGLATSFDVVASGCAALPTANQSLQLPAFEGLSNNTLYYVLLSTHSDVHASNTSQQQPLSAVYAVRTIDNSPPRMACGFPLATNISSAGFALSAMLTKPAAAVFYVVLPADRAGTPPSADEVVAGRGAGGAAAAAAGRLVQSGWLPWEAAPAASSGGDALKQWVAMSGLDGGANYTAFLVVSTDGSSPAPGTAVAALTGILTPDVTPPSYTTLSATGMAVDEGSGTFSLTLQATLDRPGAVRFAMYRNYSCISGTPSPSDIAAGGPLPASVCTCEDTSYCAAVAAGGADALAASGSAAGAAASLAIAGNLSALPFEALRDAGDDKLKCFQGGLGQATDSYLIYLVAANELPTYTGLAPQCASYEQAAATAAGKGGAACTGQPQLACAQPRVREDKQVWQTGTPVAWQAVPTNSSGNSSSNNGTSLAWQQPASGAWGRPAKLALSLESGAPPSFVWGPLLPGSMQTADSFGITFSLDRAALFVYAVFRPQGFDASGLPQSPVLIATGRVPVFAAGQNASTGPITACPWAPGGAMQAGSTLLVNYVARDKYGRQDGPCPGRAAGSGPQVCTALATTAGG